MKICDCCFKDPEIVGFIQSKSIITDICDCCGSESKFVDLELLADFFESFFSIFKYDEAEGVPLIDLIQNDWNIFSSRECGIKILDELFIELNLQLNLLVSEVSGYAEIKVSYIDEIKESVDYWDELKTDLKCKRRFLTDIANLEEKGWDAAFNVFSVVDSSVLLYRSRINLEGDTKPYSETKMKSPPSSMALAGRANPQGIPYLYLSRDLRTTLYESRATFLDYVSVGKFQLEKDSFFQIVDFTKKESPFNRVYDMVNFAKGKFIRKIISQDLSKPLRRYDSELEYIPTQFICEYIRFFTQPAIGIQFESSLNKEGVNVVLFDETKINCISVETHQVTKIDIDSECVNEE